MPDSDDDEPYGDDDDDFDYDEYIEDEFGGRKTTRLNPVWKVVAIILVIVFLFPFLLSFAQIVF